MLIILSGLPGAGKTTIGKRLAIGRAAAYVRVDEIEHALSRHAEGDIGAAGYVAAYAVASSNLQLGRDVVADSVNPVPESREAWRDVAIRAASPFVEIEIVCSDRAEHRRRVETRLADIAGFSLPSWPSVEAHHYVPWASTRLVVDTAKLGIEAAVAEIEAHLDLVPGYGHDDRGGQG